MNRTEALAAVRIVDSRAALEISDDPACDDQIILCGNDNIAVQISATRDGLRFCASVASGDGDDFGVRHGDDFSDPVPAAQQALEYARFDGVL